MQKTTLAKPYQNNTVLYTTPWLASWPRCGNTMTRILLSHHFGIETPGTDGRLIRETVPITTPQRTDVQFVKTHQFTREAWTDFPALLIVRDPRDAWVSWAHYNLNFRGAQGKLASEFERYKKGKWRTTGTMTMFFEPWLARPAPKTVLRYEDLVKASEPYKLVSDALAELGIENTLLTAEPPPSFATLQACRPKFFRRGIIGSHKDELGDDFRKFIEELEAPIMERFGYSV